jgi:cytochrome c oxidase cbb3-type subunit 2
MSDFRTFARRLILSFGLPWLILIIIPVIRYQSLQPVPYDKEVDGVEGFFPQNVPNRQGQLVYAREGCVQCHSQMIRPAQLTMDGWRKGWGEDQSARPAEAARAHTMRDYLFEPFAFLGSQRVGPDLANAGWRFEDRAEVHRQLYAPRADSEYSVMPAYKHLYRVRVKQGQGAANALDLPAPYAPQSGYEVVPTAEAEALVDYILSLRKTEPLPGISAMLSSADAK